MKKGFKICLVVLIIIFIGLYFVYKDGYYERRNAEKKILTEEMIQEYEDDLKKGIDVSQKEYVILTHDYSNQYTKTFLKISQKIEKSLDQTIKYLFKAAASP